MRLTAAILVCAGLLQLCSRSIAALSTGEVTERVSTNRGLCLHIGAGTGELSARFAVSGALVVHGLERDPAKVMAARQALQQNGLYGRVAIESWRADGLPYASGLANVIVAQTIVPEQEVTRVLAPGGTAYIQRGDAWAVVRKPWPSDLDEWTHSRHGADGNMVSADKEVEAPTGVRWIGGPAQDEGGKKWYYDHVLVSANGRNYYVYETEIIARDAFNGVLLWKREIKSDVFREVGTDVPEFLRAKVRKGGRPSKVRPVAISNSVYAAAEGKLVALDGRSGDTMVEFGAVSAPRELLVSSNTLVASDANAVRAYDVNSRRKLWESSIAPERIVAGDGKVFCLAGKIISAIDIETGTELWRAENPEADPATTCTYHNGALVLEMSSWRDDAAGCGVIVYSGEEGKVLWKKEYKPDMTHYKEARAMFARDLLWLQSGANTIVGHDPKTGEPKQTWGSRGKHCATPVATGRFFIAPECEFTDLETGERSRARMFKSACRLPFIPANGLLYTFPVQCECFPMLRGYMGMSGEEEKIVSGPDFEAVAQAPQHASVTEPDSWPMYRRDRYRSASAPAGVKGAAPGSVLVDSGLGYIAAGRHPMCDGGVQVIAFKPRTGELVWRKQIDDLTAVITNWYGPTIAPKVKAGLDFEPVDMLVRDGDSVAMSRWRFQPADGAWKLAVASTNYSAIGQAIPRGAWGYGIRQTKLVLPRKPLAFDEAGVRIGAADSTALIIAGGKTISATATEISVGATRLTTASPVVRDGLIVAYGRLYASTEGGELMCFE